MCTKEEVKSEVENALRRNNEVRDTRFDLKLSQNNEKILSTIKKMVDDSMPSNDIPKEIAEIKNQCVARGTTLVVTTMKMEIIEKKIDSVSGDVKRLSETIDKMVTEQIKKREEESLAREVKESAETKAREIRERELDIKYAPMAAWSAMKFIGGAIALAIIGAIMGVILIK